MVLQQGTPLRPVQPGRAGCDSDLFGRGADDLQQEEEDLDNVDVDGERSEHVLLGTDGVLPVPYQQLCVVRQELQGEQTSNKSVLQCNTNGLFVCTAIKAYMRVRQSEQE